MQLFYFASPMCSWCWGFSPVIQQLEKQPNVENIRLILTPFRTDTTEPMDDALRNYVLGQWHKVHQTTGQPFDFDFAVPKDFIYNTTLVCLSIKAFKKQLPECELEYLRKLQQAFYTENKELTNEKILLKLTESYQVDMNLFQTDLHSDNIKKLLQDDFALCKELQVNSYPTLLAKLQGNYSTLANGYLSFEEINLKLHSLQ